MRDYQTRPVLAGCRIAAVAEVVRRRSDAPSGAIGVAFVDDDLMIDYHSRFMGDHTTTDVLSFPDELGAIAGGIGLQSEGERNPHRYWGDVIVCTDQAARQARDLGHPYLYELTVLIVHGALHLLGYDHMRDAGRMHCLEERLRPLCRVAGMRA